MRREFSLTQRNFLPGMWVYNLICALVTLLIYHDTQSKFVIYWLIVMTTVSILGTVTLQSRSRYRGQQLKKDGRIILAVMTTHCFMYSYLLFVYIPAASPVLVMALTIATASMAAGSVAFSSPFVPGFVASSYPTMLSLSSSLILREDSEFNWLAVSCIFLLAGLTWFALIMAKTVRHSVRTSLQNKSLVKDLRSALVQTDEANRAKSVFLASASHDLRQPLHALGLLTETMGGTKLDDQQIEIHDHMMSAVESTRSMLDALLNISKLDAGAILSDPKPFFVQSLLAKLEAELAPTADENQLIYRTRETIAAAHSDPFIVELILRNLIANAIRYTPSGGLLVACRRRKPNRLILEVWDTGIGICENQMNDIFSEFKQLNNPERDSRKGFGLGLAIAQGLAKTIDSKIQVASRQGVGSVFRFEIPVTKAEVIEDLPESKSSVANFSGKRILVIDDDPRILASMLSVLKSWKCECIGGESADETLSQLNDFKPDLLLVDYRLRENKTGREAIESIRAFTNRHIPAIIITGDTGAERIVESQAADALLLHKPASTRQLQRMMLSLLDH